MGVRAPATSTGCAIGSLLLVLQIAVVQSQMSMRAPVSRWTPIELNGDELHRSFSERYEQSTYLLTRLSMSMQSSMQHLSLTEQRRYERSLSGHIIGS